VDVTDWQLWFLGCLSRAIAGADAAGGHVLRKANFWQRHARVAFSERRCLAAPSVSKLY
jgi:hypothetical protein